MNAKASTQRTEVDFIELLLDMIVVDEGCDVVKPTDETNGGKCGIDVAN
jgi:hypothetical protein